MKPSQVKGTDLLHEDILYPKHAAMILNKQPDGACLVRGSTKEGQYFLSVKNGKDILELPLTEQDKNNLFQWTDCSRFIQDCLSRLEDMGLRSDLLLYSKKAHEKGQILKKEEPVRELGADLNHGAMTREEAFARLKNQPYGTCLLRFSKNHNAHFLSVRTPGGSEEIKLDSRLAGEIVEKGLAAVEKKIDANFASYKQLMPYTKTDYAQDQALAHSLQPTGKQMGNTRSAEINLGAKGAKKESSDSVQSQNENTPRFHK